MSERRHASRRLVAAISSGLLLSACAPELPIGRFACHTDRDCPEGWSCAPDARGVDRCFPAGTDFDWIHGSGDSGGAGELAPEAGPMSTDPDAATPPPPDKPTPPAASRGGSSSPPPAAGSGSSPAAGSGGAPQPTAGAPSEPPPTMGGCKEEAPDASKGVFVSPTGVTASDCGSAAQPCSTVKRGIERAKASNRELVYLDSGTYSEPVVLQAGLHLQGGYSRTQGDWKRLCTTNRAERARINSPTEVGLWAEYDGDSVLEALTIQTLPQAPTGHSMYGLFARGSSTRLKLREVNVLAASGGNGQKGTNASTPDPRTGTCTPTADGTNGTTVGHAGEPGAAGSFTDLGYVPGDGTPGGAGQPGKNGSGGGMFCRDCIDTCIATTCQGQNIVGQSCGIAGGSGCGGLGAAGGGEGLGGGSSIGVFVWAAQVEVEGGLLQAGDGGSGGLGGEPGQGGVGSDGGPGMNGASCTVCVKSTIIIDPPPVDTTAKDIQANKEASATDSPAVGRPVPIDGGIIVPPVQCING
ncbi:MAG TPA: hypothetical protein VJV78_01705, partial [Polyangiales bacterium]|nr:hypothetical protein [Polyangiales bacterium]